MVNTDYGRDLLCIDRNLPPVVRIGANFVTCEKEPGHLVSDFRIGQKFGNVVRHRFPQFQSYSRYFLNDDRGVTLSPLTRYARSIVATTETAYPDAGTGGTTVDGAVLSPIDASWDTAHDATTGSTAYTTNTSRPCDVGRTGGSYFMYRNFFLFDTSAIPTADEIDSAALSLYATSKQVNDNDAQAYIGIVQSSPASNSTIATSDFDQCGAVNNPDKAAERTIDANSTSAYNDYTFNATGRGWIDPDGVTKLGSREGHDIEDSVFGGGVNDLNRVIFSHADNSGTTQDPKLVVEHSEAAEEATGNFFLMM